MRQVSLAIQRAFDPDSPPRKLLTVFPNHQLGCAGTGHFAAVVGAAVDRDDLSGDVIRPGARQKNGQRRDIAGCPSRGLACAPFRHSRSAPTPPIATYRG